jgi:hypothetical protein
MRETLISLLLVCEKNRPRWWTGKRGGTIARNFIAGNASQLRDANL